MVKYMNINKLKKEISSPDYIFKEINISGIKTYLIFNEVLTNSQRIDEITWYLITKIKRRDFKDLIYKIPGSNTKIIEKKDIEYYLNNGFVVLCYKKLIAIELRSSDGRSVQNISSELSIGGARDAFTENINTNLNLIRKRIKSDLRIKTIIIGRLSKTKVDILYMENKINLIK